MFTPPVLPPHQIFCVSPLSRGPACRQAGMSAGQRGLRYNLTMIDIKDLEQRIELIEKRNEKVEIDKAWETSFARRALLLFMTYLVIGFYMNAIKIADPWVNAIVPSIGFLLSTLTLPFFKTIWLKYKK